MTKDGINVSQRDIVLIPFPFTDLSQAKRRPAMILSNEEYNRSSEDFICCAITSNPKSYRGSIKIHRADFESGYLEYESRVKPDKIFTLNQKSIVKRLAKLNLNRSKEVIRKLNVALRIH